MTNKGPHLRPRTGTVYLIGAGPGDPGLITVKAMSKIRSVDVIVYDYLAGNLIIQESRPDAEIIYVGKQGKSHTLEQAEINKLLILKARQGMDVARIKGGDPYVFGRGGEEAEDLVNAGIPFEVIPGVSSAIAAPAYAGIPVTHRDHASMVTFVTGHENPLKPDSAIDWAVLAASPGTLVFLMGVKNLGNISDSLINHGKPPHTPAALIRWGTTPQQVSIFSTIKDIPFEAEKKGITAPAVLVVGSVVSLGPKLEWFEQKPLFGKKILVTRSLEQSRTMADKITECGADPILFPTIRIDDLEDFGHLDHCIRSISNYDWILFTSVNGVQRFFKRFFSICEDIRELSGPQIGAIGPVTAAEVRKFGLKVALTAEKFVAENLLNLLSEKDLSGKRFLIPRAEKAREILPQGIKDLGAEVDAVPVYRTTIPSSNELEQIRAKLENSEIDVVTFTSSSTVTHFVEMLGPDRVPSLTERVVVASIGPITSETARNHGLKVDVEANEFTVDGIVNALATFFTQMRNSSPHA